MLKNRLSNQISCLNCAVSFLCLPRELSLADQVELNELLLQIESVGQGSHVFHAGDMLNNLYAVYSGSCKTYRIDVDGNERIDNFYFPGDIIGFESIAARKHMFSLVALDDLELCIIPVEDLFNLMQKNQQLLKRVIDITSYKMLNDQFFQMSTTAKNRVIDFILNIYFRLKERGQNTENLNLSMSQLDISNFLGIAHETVNRILRKLHKDKIIKIQQKKIYIVDIDNLIKMGTSLKAIAMLK